MQRSNYPWIRAELRLRSAPPTLPLPLPATLPPPAERDVPGSHGPSGSDHDHGVWGLGVPSKGLCACVMRMHCMWCVCVRCVCVVCVVCVCGACSEVYILVGGWVWCVCVCVCEVCVKLTDGSVLHPQPGDTITGSHLSSS